MDRFKNILFCPLGDKASRAVATRVVDLTERNGAELTLIEVIPEPSLLQRALHRDAYLEEVQEADRKEAAAKLARMFPDRAGSIQSRIEVGTPALAIIERVLIREHDLVIVTTDDDDEDHATIKRLLRKCPCPVWVVRPTRARTQRVLAAVNPDPSEAGLNKTILELAASMVRRDGGELHVVHAWQLYGEATMRSSGFVHTSRAELEKILTEEQASHRMALSQTLAESDVDGAPWKIHLRKGPSADVVRQVVAKHKINLLVMGTVARTGMSGLMMGNTAESVIDQVRCSLIAVKPEGFVSPISVVVK